MAKRNLQISEVNRKGCKQYQITVLACVFDSPYELFALPCLFRTVERAEATLSRIKKAGYYKINLSHWDHACQWEGQYSVI